MTILDQGSVETSSEKASLKNEKLHSLGWDVNTIFGHFSFEQRLVFACWTFEKVPASDGLILKRKFIYKYFPLEYIVLRQQKKQIFQGNRKK